MNLLKRDRILGCILGLVIGDAFGAPFEGGVLERGLWHLIGRRNGKRRWTDDTQMTLDVMESLIACGGVDQNDLACRLAISYRWSRGYGPGAARVLKRIRRGEPWDTASRAVFRDGSYGNGAAMRSPVVGLFFATAPEQELVEAARACAAVTHGHPLGREGAVLIAAATALAAKDATSSDIIDRLSLLAKSPEFSIRLEVARKWLESDQEVTPKQVATELGNGIAAAESCITAVYLGIAFRSNTLDDLLKFTISLKGDVDTIAAMACAIWGAARSVEALPKSKLQSVESSKYLRDRAEAFAEAALHQQET